MIWKVYGAICAVLFVAVMTLCVIWSSWANLIMGMVIVLPIIIWLNWDAWRKRNGTRFNR